MREAFLQKIDGLEISLHPLSNKTLRGWSFLSENALILSTEWIDTKAKAEQLVKEVQQLDLAWKSKPKELKFHSRFLLGLLADAQTEWEQIVTQEILQTWMHHEHSFSVKCAQLLIPAKPFYLSTNLAEESEFFLKEIRRLEELQNLEAWETYCGWMSEEIELLLEKIPLESMEFYTLEAHLINFIHEVHSSLLSQNENEKNETKLKIGALRQLLDFPVKNWEELSSLEMTLIKIRMEMESSLKIQYEMLIEIEDSIEKAGGIYHDLASLKNKIVLLHTLMKGDLNPPVALRYSWEKKLMLMQLLNEELGVVSLITSVAGNSRPCFGLAVLLAISIIKSKQSKIEGFEMAIHWDSQVKEMNKKLAERGISHFSKWLKEPGENLQEISQKKQWQLIVYFKQIFWEILTKISIPLAKPKEKMGEAFHENLLYLNLLPFMDHDTQIVLLDEEGMPKGLTKAGHEILSKLEN